MSTEEAFALRGDHITLDALLKACGAVSSGGEAKQLIASSAVCVNGIVDLRRGRKLRAGDRVAIPGRQLHITGAVEPATDAGSGLGL